MKILLDFNYKISKHLSKYLHGTIGIITHGFILLFIFTLVGLLADFLIYLLLTSLKWLIPLIIIISSIALLIYFLNKISNEYK